MAFQKYAISGYPSGADEATPGAIINARNLIIARIGIAARRGPVKDLSLGDPCAQIRGIASALSSPWFCWEDPSTGQLRVGNTNTLPGFGFIGAAPTAGFSSIPLPDAAGEIFPVYPPIVLANDPGVPFGFGTSTFWQLGCPRAQDITLGGYNNGVYETELSVTAAAGASNPTLGFNPGDIAAYRAVLSYDRATVSSGFVVPSNNVFNVVGAVGGRFLYARPSTGSGVLVPVLRIRLPKSLVSYTTPASNGYPSPYVPPRSFTTYLSVYRSVLTAEAVAAPGGVWEATPSDTMFEVFRTVVTSTDISTGYIDFVEVCPLGSEGPPLYTNVASGGPDLDAYLPPFAASAVQFKGTLFWGAPRDVNLRTSIIVSGPPPVFAATVTVSGGVISFPLPTGVTGISLQAGQLLSIFTAGGGTPSSDYPVTSVSFGSNTVTAHVSGPPADGSYPNCFVTWGKITISDGNLSWILQLSFNSSANGTANKILVRLPLDPSSGLLTIPSQAYTQAFAGDLCTAINITCNSGTPDVTASLNAAPTLAAATIMLEYTANTLANLNRYVTVVVAGLARSIESLASIIQPVQPATSIQQSNALWWSPQYIYDSVCPSYQENIGSPHGVIIKIIATKDALYIFKTDGIWLLSGNASGGTSWGGSITLLSDSVIALSATAIDVFEDTVYVATNIGIVSIAGAAISVISGGVQQEYQDALAAQGGVGQMVLATSYQDFSLRLGVPTGGTGFATCVTFVYSFISGQWLVGHETGARRYHSDTHVGTQYETPLSTRVAIKLFDSSGLIVRLPCSQGTPYLCSCAVEGGQGSFQTQGNGEARTSTDDSQTVTFVYDGTAGHYHFVGPIANPDANLNLAGIWVTGGGQQQFFRFEFASYSSDSTPEVKISILINDFNGPGGLAGTQTIFIPIDVNAVFAPIGDGSSAYDFNQVGLLQTRRSSAKQLAFSFWLDTANTYPYVAPEVITLTDLTPEPQVNARNVTRAGVPPQMTRGSRLNVQVFAGTTGEERTEFSQLLIDATPIAGEEISYG